MLTVEERVLALSVRYAGHSPQDIVAGMIGDEFPGRITVVTSFGAESAVLLHMVAQVERHTPVVFVDTGMLFEEALAYRDRLVEQLGLGDVRSIRPERSRIEERDPQGTLWRTDADGCCTVRKVDPLHQALMPFDAWFTGRKAYHGDVRESLQVFEAADGRVKVNPVASTDSADIHAYYRRHSLPYHPLVSEGFSSIGCRPCTDRVSPGEPIRAGRWRGQQKSECGIHAPRGSS